MNIQKHWSVNIAELEKDPESFAIWKLEQWVNWGIGAPRVKRADLLTYWDRLDLDPWKRKALQLALF